MVLDAVLAYLHFISIFVLFAFLTTQAVLIRGPLDERAIRLIGRTDRWYGAASMLVLFTGFLRLGLGPKGADFYLHSWPIYVKVGLFLVVGLMSIYPTLAYIRWRRALDDDPQWRVPDREHKRMRKVVMAEIHLAALIPIFAVIMSRGLGR